MYGLVSFLLIARVAVGTLVRGHRASVFLCGSRITSDAEWQTLSILGQTISTIHVHDETNRIIATIISWVPKVLFCANLPVPPSQVAHCIVHIWADVRSVRSHAQSYWYPSLRGFVRSHSTRVPPVADIIEQLRYGILRILFMCYCSSITASHLFVLVSATLWRSYIAVYGILFWNIIHSLRCYIYVGAFRQRRCYHAKFSKTRCLIFSGSSYWFLMHTTIRLQLHTQWLRCEIVSNNVKRAGVLWN